MILIEVKIWECHVLGAIPLVEFALFSKSLGVIFNAALQTCVAFSRLIVWHLSHQLQKEIMLVHVWHELESNLNLFE